jgi:hypothetical protein
MERTVERMIPMERMNQRPSLLFSLPLLNVPVSYTSLGQSIGILLTCMLFIILIIALMAVINLAGYFIERRRWSVI